MADAHIPHFQNDQGVDKIEIGAREFMCVGAAPPFDHPHVFLDVGAEGEIVCPYCSTLFVHNNDLSGDDSVPENCQWNPKAA